MQNATLTEEGAAGGMTAPAVPWKDVWAAMKWNGWTWKGGSGLMTGYYYIKPRCKVQGGKAGREYFVRVERDGYCLILFFNVLLPPIISL